MEIAITLLREILHGCGTIIKSPIAAVALSFIIPALAVIPTGLVNSIVDHSDLLHSDRKMYFLLGPELSIGALSLCIVWVIVLICSSTSEDPHTLLRMSDNIESYRFSLISPFLVMLLSVVALLYSISNKMAIKRKIWLDNDNRSVGKLSWNIVLWNDIWGALPFGIASVALVRL